MTTDDPALYRSTWSSSSPYLHARRVGAHYLREPQAVMEATHAIHEWTHCRARTVRRGIERQSAPEAGSSTRGCNGASRLSFSSRCPKGQSRWRSGHHLRVTQWVDPEHGWVPAGSQRTLSTSLLHVLTSYEHHQAGATTWAYARNEHL